MTYEPVGQHEALGALRAAYGAFTNALEGLDDRAFLQPTLCSGWVVGDLVFHHMLDAQRALITLSTPSNDEPDVDFVSYWRPWSANDDTAIAHARFVRVAASAYATRASLVGHRRVTAEAAIRAAEGADSAGRVATQGHTLTVPDFLATLAVEAAIHHLDLVAYIDAPGPHPDGLALARRTLDGLAGVDAGTQWDDRLYALKGTGRQPLTDEERERLGPLADAFPLFS